MKTLFLFLSIILNYYVIGINKLSVEQQEKEINNRLFLLVSATINLIGNILVFGFIWFALEVGHPPGKLPSISLTAFITYVLLQSGLLWVVFLESNRTKKLIWGRYFFYLGTTLFLFYVHMSSLSDEVVFAIVILSWISEVFLYRKEILRSLEK